MSSSMGSDLVKECADLLQKIGIDPEREASDILINGRNDYYACSHPPRDGDRMGVFPCNMRTLYC